MHNRCCGRNVRAIENASGQEAALALLPGTEKTVIRAMIRLRPAPVAGATDRIPAAVTQRALLPGEFGMYREHLLRLSPEDRRLRFQHPISDEAIGRFVGSLAPSQNRILAVLDSNDRVIAVVQIAIGRNATAELAFSVDAAWRNRGLAGNLLASALIWAKAQGIRRVCMSCLARNRSMLRLAMKVGMTVVQEAGVSDCVLDLAPSRPLLRAAGRATSPLYWRAMRRRLLRPLAGATPHRGGWSGAFARWRTRLDRPERQVG
jgi:RimJ/RimL family protein N-acetyltransferase